MAWTLITDFGDSAAMLPAAALLLGWLAVQGRTRSAILWVALFVAQSSLVAATKIAFRGWGIGMERLDFTGISGHATLACSVIPIALSVIAHRARPAIRLMAAFSGLAAGSLIGISRVALAQHSWSEALAGCALGGIATVLFLASADPADRRPSLPTPLIAGTLACLLLLMHGAHAPSERILTRIALHLSGHATPYTRWSFREPWSLWRGPSAHDSLASSGEAPVHARSLILRDVATTDRG